MLTPYAIDLLTAAKAAILAEPKQFLMSGFYHSRLDYLPSDLERTPAAGCGTAACIAGHLQFLRLKDQGSATTISQARELVNIMLYDALDKDRLDEILQKDLDLPSTWLFFLEQWPHWFRRRWQSADSFSERAVIAGEVIDLYVQIGGEEHGKPTR